MKIGITEQGDGGLNTSWFDKLSNVDAAIIITKKLTDDCIEKLLAASKPVTLHCGCTGNGGSYLEPNVPDYTWQLGQLKTLLLRGFPANRVVLRIDPIIPTDECLSNATKVLDYIISNQIPISRVRISVYDEYNHVKDRLRAIGHEPFYANSFYASPSMMQKVVDVLSPYPFIFETCAENLN